MKLLTVTVFLLFTFPTHNRDYRAKYEITREALRNKIKGAWSGQVIGLSLENEKTFASADASSHDDGRTDAEAILETILNPGNELLVDLAYFNILDTLGESASAKDIGAVLVSSNLNFDHALQAARFNIANGILPPSSGHWLHNPHADDIDFRNISDFIGLINPGMPQQAAKLANTIGHISQSGDGYYAGLYVATLYSLCFTEKNVDNAVKKALKAIPYKSEFYQCIQTVIDWHKQSPKDWQKTWSFVTKKWNTEFGCPVGVHELSGDGARINTAYIVMALLYGEGNFDKSLSFAIKAGQAYRQNAATTAGILGAFIGYDSIPDTYTDVIFSVGRQPIGSTNLSLNDLEELTYKHAVKNIDAHRGKVKGNTLSVTVEEPKTVAMEKCFAGHYPIAKHKYDSAIVANVFHFDFEGIGFLITGKAISSQEKAVSVELYLDNKYQETITIPVASHDYRPELVWKYQLAHRKYKGKLRIVNPSPDKYINIRDLIVYDVRTK